MLRIFFVLILGGSLLTSCFFDLRIRPQENQVVPETPPEESVQSIIDRELGVFNNASSGILSVYLEVWDMVSNKEEPLFGEGNRFLDEAEFNGYVQVSLKIFQHRRLEAHKTILQLMVNHHLDFQVLDLIWNKITGPYDDATDQGGYEVRMHLQVNVMAALKEKLDQNPLSTDFSSLYDMLLSSAGPKFLTAYTGFGNNVQLYEKATREAFNTPEQSSDPLLSADVAKDPSDQ